MQTEKKLTLTLIPTSKGLYTGLVYKKYSWPDLTLKWRSNRRNGTIPGWEDDDIRGRQLTQDAGPTWLVWSFIVFSWLLIPLHINQMLFYHRPGPMLVLEINPIFGSLANYLCLVLGYLGEFLYSKALTGWPRENLL